MEHQTRTRRALSTVLAIFLAVETVSAVAAAAVTTRSVTHELPPEPPAGGVLALETDTLPDPGVVVVTVPSPAPSSTPRIVEPAEIVVAAPVEPTKATRSTKADKATRTEKAAKSTKSTKTHKSPKPAVKSSPAKPVARSYSGTNHVWIPSLGITRSVRWFPCARSRPPDNYMYRWGCSGANNVYLMGHAYSIMKPLHDAYVRGRLRVGMKAYYADGTGKVRTYAVKWWKVTRPTTAASWAWAAQSVPSMTLQTCVGKNSEYRLMVRLRVVRG